MRLDKTNMPSHFPNNYNGHIISLCDRDRIQ